MYGFRLPFWVMFGALVLGAVGGCVLLSGGPVDLGYSVFLTGLLAAVCIGVPISGLVCNLKSDPWSAIALTFACTIIEFLMAVRTIWGDSVGARTTVNFDFGEIVFIPVAIWTITCLREWSATQTGLAARTGFWLGVAGLVLCLAGYELFDILALPMAVSVECMLISDGMKGNDWRWIGLICVVLTAASIWQTADPDNLAGTILLVIVPSTVLLFAYANFMLSFPLAPDKRWLVPLAVFMEAMTLFLASPFTAEKFDRFVPITAIWTAIFTLLVAILSARYRRWVDELKIPPPPLPLEDAETALP